MTECGAAHGIERDWHVLANEHRRHSLRRMTNTIDPVFNIDDFHRDVFNELFDENQIGGSPEGSWRESASSSWMVRAASASRSPRTLPLSYRTLTAPGLRSEEQSGMLTEYPPGSEAAPAYNSLLPLYFVLFAWISGWIFGHRFTDWPLIARTTLKPNTSQI
jgi:hypothetical protein